MNESLRPETSGESFERRARGGLGLAGRAQASALRDQVRAGAEDRPGVYRWMGRGGRILYVGKSVRLRTRLLSYFRQDAGKTARMVAEAEAVRWDYAPNEFAALFREMRLIRAWQPEYNVQHKRDRRFGFIKVTREAAPRLAPVSRPASDGARYYGPFSRTGWMARAVHELALATGLRDCAADTPVRFGDQIEMFPGARSPLCIRAETGTCPAPCAGRCTAAEYDRRVGLARAFLEARSRAPLRELSEAVRRASERLDFEYAARLHERMTTLEGLWDHLSGFRGQIEKMNLVYPVRGFAGDDRVYLIRRGRLHSELPRPKSDGARRRAKGLVEEAFRPTLADRDFSLEGAAAADVLLTMTWFSRRPKERRRAVAPEKWLRGRRAPGTRRG